MARFWFALAVLLAAAVYFSASKGQTADSTPKKAVVVELFTSEGCSSCPPADALLGHLRQDLAAKNVQVIPLGFHVDYWNSQGWKDRFSSADFTHRQELYARSLKVDGPYTPQMVVDGTIEFVGGNAGQAERVISQAASQPEAAEVKISADGADHLTVNVKAPAAGSGNVMLAITEDNLSTQVGAGENNGHTLHHAAVVREFRQLGKLHDGGFTANLPLKLKADWKRADLRAIVFVQEDPTGKIEGAASVALMGQPR
jgi:hypothetical protein